MKDIKHLQRIRLAVQLLAVTLTAVGFFTNFKFTMIGVMIATIFAGVYYCGWICPYGTVQDLMSRLGKKMGIKKRKMPRAIQKYLVFARYILFVLTVLAAFQLIVTIANYDARINFINLLSGNQISITAMSVLASYALIALFFDRPFCNYLCTQGATYGLISSLRIFTIKRNKDACVNCKKCDKACPMNIEVSTCGQLRSPQCINCFQCINECPVENALTYGRIELTKNEKKRIGVITAVAILAIGGVFLFNNLLGNNIQRLEHTSTPDQIVSEVGAETNERTPKRYRGGSVSYAQSNESVTNDLSTIVQPMDPDIEFADGTYMGSASAFKGIMDVEVVVEDSLIQSVTVIDHNDDWLWFNRANNAIPDQIISTQSTNVDTVSGATYSSMGIINGTRDALKDAEIK